MSISSDTDQSQFVGYETEMRVQFSLLAFLTRRLKWNGYWI